MNFETTPNKASAEHREAVRIGSGFFIAAVIGVLSYLTLRELPSLVEVRSLLLTKFSTYQGVAAQLAPFIFGFLMVAQVVNTALCYVGRRLKVPRFPGKEVYFWLVPLVILPAVWTMALVVPVPSSEVSNLSLFGWIVGCSLLMAMLWIGFVLASENTAVVDVNSPVVEDYHGNPVRHLARAKFLLCLAFLAMGFNAMTFATWAAMSVLDYFLCSAGTMPYDKRRCSY